MNLKDIREMMDGFGRYLDNYAGIDSVEISEAVKNKQINWAYRLIGRRLNLFDPMISFNCGPSYAISGTNGAQFNLRSATVAGKIVWEPLSINLSGNVLYNSDGRPGFWSEAQLRRARPSYPTESTGNTDIAVHLGNGKILISQPPASTLSNCSIAGTYVPADMSGDTAEPDIPVELHECIAYCAAARVAYPTATEQEQWARMKAYNEEWMILVTEESKRNRNAITGPWSDDGFSYKKLMRV